MASTATRDESRTMEVTTGQEAGGGNKGSIMKCCGMCCGVVTVVLIIFGVLVHFVIAPKMAQQTLDEAELMISNATMFNLPTGSDLVNGATGKLANTGTMSSSFPLDAVVEEFEVTLIANAGFNHGPTVPIGSFIFPRLAVHKGMNKAEFVTELKVLNSSVLTDFGLTTQFCKHWDNCIPSMGVPSLNLTMSGSPTLTTLGFAKVHGLKIEKHLECIQLAAPAAADEADADVDVDVQMDRRLAGTLSLAMQFRMKGSDALPEPTTTTAPEMTV